MSPRYIEEMLTALRKKYAAHEMDMLGVADEAKPAKIVPSDFGTYAVAGVSGQAPTYPPVSVPFYQASMGPTPRSKWIGAIADALRAGKDLGPVGELIVGDAYKPIDELSYGNSPTNRSLGASMHEQNPGMADLALLLAPGMGKVLKTTKAIR
jgi:hypothetical protein